MKLNFKNRDVVIHFHYPGQFQYPTDKRDKMRSKKNEKLFINVAHDVSMICIEHLTSNYLFTQTMYKLHRSIMLMSQLHTPGVLVEKNFMIMINVTIRYITQNPHKHMYITFLVKSK